MLESIVVLGGSSSGKSQFAEQLTREMELLHKCAVFYLATGVVCDQEFATRVKRHQDRRPQHWHTIEEPRYLAQAIKGLQPKPAIVLLDGVGTWVANFLYGEKASESPSARLERACIEELQVFISSWSGLSGALIMVADEVGMGLVPEYPQARRFRDLNGQVNQLLAARARQVYFVTAGLASRIKGGSS